VVGSKLRRGFPLSSRFGWLGPLDRIRSWLSFDILPAASGEDSYGLRCFLRGFGGFLPQPPYFSGGLRRGFTFGLPAHRSSGHEEYRTGGTKKKERALYPRPETRGFTARMVKGCPQLHAALAVGTLRGIPKTGLAQFLVSSFRLQLGRFVNSSNDM
jgi:hypothetical protein